MFLQQLALAVGSGALFHLALGRSEPNVVAGVFAVALLAFALSRVSSGARGLGHGALIGVVSGLAAWLPSAGFVVAGAKEAGASALHAVAVAFAVALLHALRVGFAGLVATRLDRAGVPIGLATALAWLAAEMFDPAPMPWSLGAASVDVPWLSAAADLGGPPLAGLAVALAGGILADAGLALRRSAREPRWLRLIAPLALGALVVRGAFATSGIEHATRSAPRQRVAAIHTDWRRGTTRPSAALLRATVDAASREADVVVLPEAVLWFTSQRVAEDVLAATFEGATADVLVGAGWGPHTAQVNAVAWVAPGGGAPQWYVKTRPFPVGEAGDGAGAVLGLRDGPGVVVRGDASSESAFRLRGVEVAPAICWEDLFDDAASRAGERPGWIAASINDGWFAGSRAGALHLLHARIRAVEARRAMVRATNEGATAIVDPLGGAVLRGPGHAYVVADVPALDGATFAIRSRGAASWVLAALTVAGALVAPARLRPRATSAAS